MNQVEDLRRKLYDTLESGNTKEILKVSQELDKLIVDFTQRKLFESEQKIC